MTENSHSATKEQAQYRLFWLVFLIFPHSGNSDKREYRAAKITNKTMDTELFFFGGAGGGAPTIKLDGSTGTLLSLRTTIKQITTVISITAMAARLAKRIVKVDFLSTAR